MPLPGMQYGAQQVPYLPQGRLRPDRYLLSIGPGCVYHLAATMRLSRAYTHNHPTNTQRTHTYLSIHLFILLLYVPVQRHNITTQLIYQFYH
jgi:hypothetical protein